MGHGHPTPASVPLQVCTYAYDMKQMQPTDEGVVDASAGEYSEADKYFKLYLVSVTGVLSQLPHIRAWMERQLTHPRPGRAPPRHAHNVPSQTTQPDAPRGT